MEKIIMSTRWIYILVFYLFLSSWSQSAAWAAGPTVGANAVAGWKNPTTTVTGTPLTGLAGINVWLGTQSQVYTRQYNAGMVSSLPISNLKLVDGQYYMSVQAYDTNGLVSGLSNEVAFVLQAGNTTTTTIRTTTTSTTTTLPGPDLKETVVAGPTSAKTGAKILVVDRVQNVGTAPIGTGFSVGLYLSTDNVITTSDILLGSRPVGLLGALALSQAKTYVTIPNTVAPGVHHLGACADYSNVISETNEANNCMASSYTITIVAGTTTTTTLPVPDLKETVVIGTKLTGGNLRIIDRVQNIGTAPTGTGFSVGLYLSTDNVITTSDIKIGTRTLPVLAKLGISQAVTTLTLPSLPAGTYYVGACADDPSTIIEINEGNNCKVGNPITLP